MIRAGMRQVSQPPAGPARYPYAGAICLTRRRRLDAAEGPNCNHGSYGRRG